MIRCDALIAGGGPAGSTCARELRNAGWDVVVADRARFPRDKVCAGWLTPRVFELLELDPAEYRATGLNLQEIAAFRTGVIGGGLIETRYPRVVSYAIRRCEFDDFLLRRAGVRVLESTPVVSLKRRGDRWLVNNLIDTAVVVGAGGHFCSVARHMRGSSDTVRPVVAREAEFPLNGSATRIASDTPELFFCRDMDGYGWCVRKGDYLNVGIGRRSSQDFNRHLLDFIAYLEERDALPRNAQPTWHGHAYLASGAGQRPLSGPGMLLIGDAAGLAYPESGEGISPAIESGVLAARALTAARGDYAAASLQTYDEMLRHLYPAAQVTPAPLRTAAAAAGRLLLRSRQFTRRVVLDRWFLRGASTPPFRAPRAAAAAHSRSPTPS